MSDRKQVAFKEEHEEIAVVVAEIVGFNVIFHHRFKRVLLHPPFNTVYREKVPVTVGPVSKLGEPSVLSVSSKSYLKRQCQEISRIQLN